MFYINDNISGANFISAYNNTQPPKIINMMIIVGLSPAAVLVDDKLPFWSVVNLVPATVIVLRID